MLSRFVKVLGFVIVLPFANAAPESETCLEENVGIDVQLWQTDLKWKTSIPMDENAAVEFSVAASVGNNSRINATTSKSKVVAKTREAVQIEIKNTSKVNGLSVMALSSEIESRSFATSAGRLAVGSFASLRKVSTRIHMSPGQALAVLLLIVSFLFGALYVCLLMERNKRYGFRRAAAARHISSHIDNPTLDVARNMSARAAHPTQHVDPTGHRGHVRIPYDVLMQRRIRNHEASWEGRPYFLGPPLSQWPNSCDGGLLQINYESLLRDGAWMSKAVSSDGRELLVSTEKLRNAYPALHVETLGPMGTPLSIASMDSDLQIYTGSCTSWDRLPARFKLNELGKGVFDLVELGISAAPHIPHVDSSHLLCTSTGHTPHPHSNSKFRSRVRCRRFADSAATGLLFDMTPFDDMDVIASAKVDMHGSLEIWTCIGVDAVPILLVFVGLIVFQKKYDVYPLHDLQ